MVYGSAYQVDHGNEGIDVPVSTGSCSGCLEQTVQALQFGICMVMAPASQDPLLVPIYCGQGLLYWF